MIERKLADAAFLSIVIATVVAASFPAAPAFAEFGDQLFKLTASDAMPGDSVGVSVALSGNIALVGAHGHDARGENSGAAYVFDVTTGEQLRKLTASDAKTSDWFGASVAMSGDIALIGANQPFSYGKAYVFDVVSGQQLMTLKASDAKIEDNFGCSVAISGTTAVIGASQRFLSTGAGSAYVFDLATGQELRKLTAADSVANEEFGHRVALSGDIAIIGAPRSSSAYLFDVATGEELFKLTSSDAPMRGFGDSVAIDGNTAIAGAQTDSAYVFDVTTGKELRELTPLDPGSRFFFQSVAIRGNTAILGNGGYEEAAVGINSGAAYVFDASTGLELLKLTASDPVAIGQFGRSVAFNDNQILVGSSPHFLNENAGWAYLFDISRGPALAGDFNQDGKVDAADYVVWRDGVGSTYTQADYDTWRAHFGQTAASAAATTNLPAAAGSAGGLSPTVPEPTTLVLAVVLWTACCTVGAVRTSTLRK